MTKQSRKNGFVSGEETLTLPSAAQTDVDGGSFSVPAGKAFTIMANLLAVDTNAACVVDVLGSFDDVSFFVAKTSVVSDIDTAAVTGKYDPVNTATHGSFPFYKLRLNSAGNQSAESIKMAIVFIGGEV